MPMMYFMLFSHTESKNKNWTLKNPGRTIHVWRTRIGKKNAKKEKVKANVNYSNYPCFRLEVNFADVIGFSVQAGKSTLSYHAAPHATV